MEGPAQPGIATSNELKVHRCERGKYRFRHSPSPGKGRGSREGDAVMCCWEKGGSSPSVGTLRWGMGSVKLSMTDPARPLQWGIYSPPSPPSPLLPPCSHSPTRPPGQPSSATSTVILRRRGICAGLRGIGSGGHRWEKLAGPLAPEKLKEHRALSGSHSPCPAQEGRGSTGSWTETFVPPAGPGRIPRVLSMDGRRVGPGEGLFLLFLVPRTATTPCFL